MSSQPLASVVVGDYTLLTRIGEGGMGVVHLARRGDGQRLALKLLRPHIVGDDEARRRLAREVSSLERVRSKWVAEIIDADPWAEIPYVATRYVPGLSLHDHVHTEGSVTGTDLLWLAACLAEGLAAVHAAGVLHRDVKPSNVLMEGRTPILIDFGLARVADDPKLTHTGWLLGTPGYLAPEILYGEDATPASDVHSWAATVAFAGLGRAPFGRGPAMAVMDRVRRGEVDLVGLDGPLHDVVALALDPDPARRPGLEAILAWLRPQTTRPQPLLAPPPTGPEPVDDFTLPLEIAASVHDGILTRHVPDPGRTPAPTALDPTPHAATLVERTLPPPAPVLQPLPIAPPPVHPPARPTAQVVGQPWPASWPPPVPPVPVAERLRRGVLLTALGLLVGTLLTLAPWLVLVGVAVAVWLLRSGSLAVEAVGDRRRLRGRRWYDGLLLLTHTPWRVLQAVPGTLALLLWSLGLAAAAGLVCYAAAAAVTVSLFGCACVLVIALWCGPGANRLRSPIARVTSPAARTAGWWLLSSGATLLAAVAVAVAVHAHGTSWTPDDHRPLTRVVH